MIQQYMEWMFWENDTWAGCGCFERMIHGQAVLKE
jgi:hypothetical protein